MNLELKKKMMREVLGNNCSTKQDGNQTPLSTEVSDDPLTVSFTFAFSSENLDLKINVTWEALLKKPLN